LFTDIEGSTRRWEAHGEMAPALGRHDAIMEHAVKSHRGFVFKRIGDAFCAVFSRATDATAAAAEAQRKLSKADFSSVGGLDVRMAIHTGETEERDGDYYGPAVNRVSRLLALAHGGQVLLSSVTAELIERDRSAHTVRDLGEYRLRDVVQPQRVFQLCASGLRGDFPAPGGAEVFPTNLPQQLTSFVGREEESSSIKKLLQEERLITVAGTGGLGKTRLCLQLGAQLVPEYRDGVWLVELAPVSIAEFVPRAFAAVLHVHESGGRPVTESIVQALTHREMLLIVDNCEHVIEAAASLINAILRSCPGVRIIATSRQPLRAAGERVYRLSPLGVSEEWSDLTAAEALRCSAVALFVERAQAARQDFTLTDEGAPIVAEICHRLDGIALAIELAAARVRVLSIAHLNERLNERFRILTGGSRTELPRHQTMRALIDWSYDLLDEAEQRFFRRIAVFAGGFSLEAATEVGSGNGIDSSDVLDLVSSLVEKSLLVAETGGRVERYRLLDSTREYGLERLTVCGERETIGRVHARYYCTVAATADREFHVRPLANWFAQLRQEYDNFHAALSWALLERHDSSLGGALAGAIDRFWFEGGHLDEGLYWIDLALTELEHDMEPECVARLYLARATLSQSVQKLEAAQKACDRFERAHNDRGLGYSLRQWAAAKRQQKQWEEAESAARRAAELLEVAGDFGGGALALSTLASIRAYRGETQDAHKMHEGALAMAEAHSAEYAIIYANMHLADLEFLNGKYERAVTYASEALSSAERSRMPRLIVHLRKNRSIYWAALGRRSEALADGREALCFLRDTQDPYEIAISVQHLALSAVMSDDCERAARWIGYVDKYYASSDLEREPTEAWGRGRLEEAFHRHLSRDQLTALWRDGSLLDQPHIIDEVLQATKQAT